MSSRRQKAVVLIDRRSSATSRHRPPPGGADERHSEQLRDLMKKTDVHRLTNRMEELAEPVETSGSKGNAQRADT